MPFDELWTHLRARPRAQRRRVSTPVASAEREMCMRLSTGHRATLGERTVGEQPPRVSALGIRARGAAWPAAACVSVAQTA
jgi:hypothetical protein